jgi:hypothetical protein
MPDYCGRCGSPFEVDLDYGEARPDELFDGGVTDLWKYRALYPLTSHQYGFELSVGSISRSHFKGSHHPVRLHRPRSTAFLLFFLPLSPECVDGKFSEVHIQDAA